MILQPSLISAALPLSRTINIENEEILNNS